MTPGRTLRRAAVVLALGLVAALAGLTAAGAPTGGPEPRYRDPRDLAVTPDGAALVVACSGTDSLLVLALPEGRLVREVPVGRFPVAVALDAAGRRAYVAGRDDDTVTVVELATGEVVSRLGTGAAPQDVVLGPEGRRAFTANAASGDVSILDLESGREVKRLRAGERPRALAVSADGSVLAVANLLADPHGPDELPVGQVTLVDLAREVVTDRVELPGANLLQGIAAASDGSFVLPLVRPKNLVPLIHVDGGWAMTNGVALLRPARPGAAGEPALQLLLDTRGRHHADPTSVAISPDGRHAYVTAGGADRLLAVDLAALSEAVAGVPAAERAHLGERLDLAPRYVTAEVATGANPRAVAVSPDGRRAYVADRLADSVTVVDLEANRRAGTLELPPAGGEAVPVTALRSGERLFHNAAATFHGQFTCVTCHPDSAHDGLVYDISPDGLGRNLVDSKTLLGVRGTAPFKWSGLNPDLHTQCGPRAAMFINRSMGFSEAGLDDVVEYMASLRPEPNRNRPADGVLTPLQRQGKAIFERSVDATGAPVPESNRCVTCHAGPRGTNNRAFDVGTRSPTDDKGIFDTPALDGLTDTGPYLHDGKALTLEELWTVHNPDDRHGRANDLSKQELNALIEYLKTF